MPLENYEIIGKLGSGKYASVYKIKRISDCCYFAMKKIMLNRMTPKEKTNALSEVKLLTSISHPNIVSLVEVFYDEFIESLCLVLEIAEEGDLSKLIAQKNQKGEVMEEEEIWSVIQQISRGLQFLHSHNIIHRDIKASNILLFRNGVVKIGDLNISKINDGLFYTRTGTFTYASPEIWKGERYDCKADIWSFGCLVYELICLRKPFEGENVEEIFKKICKCQYPKIVNDAYSKELKDLVTFMIQINPKLRPSAATLCKFYRNKRCKPYVSKQQSISFNLSNIHIPGLEITPQFSETRLLETSTSTDCNPLKRQSMSRNKQYLAPIPNPIKSVKKVGEVESKPAKSRYNCKNVTRLPAFQAEQVPPNTSGIHRQITELPLKNDSYLIFKRSVKATKLKILRRNTQN